jgi:hypothetical protein
MGMLGADRHLPGLSLLVLVRELLQDLDFRRLHLG